MAELPSRSRRARTPSASAAGTTAPMSVRMPPTRKSAAAAFPISTAAGKRESMPRPGLALWLGLSALIVVLDQLSKQAILAGIEPGHRIDVLAPVFTLVLAFNPGAAFSFLAAESGWQRWFFILVALAASALIV